jgi:hypothetical protein
MPPKKRDMKDGAGKAKGYRKNAKEIRHIAHDVRGDRERKALLAIAKQFEKLADVLERQFQTETA